MRSIAVSLVFCSFIACSSDEPERNAPPVGSGGGGPGGGVSGAGTTDTDTDTGTDAGTDTALPSSSGTDTDTDTTGGDYPVLRGSFIDVGAGFLPPFTCRVKFHSLGEIDPSTGQENAVTFNAAFVIDAYPQSFEITSDQLGGIVEMGDTGFVTAECDIDGDQLFDDNAGAFYAGLPLTQISLPASGITLPVILL